MFRNRKLFKKIICGIKNYNYTDKEVKGLLEIVPIEVLRKIAKEIIYADYDGYNRSRKDGEMRYFDSLSRWQKEFYIKQRLHKLYSYIHK